MLINDKWPLHQIQRYFLGLASTTGDGTNNINNINNDDNDAHNAAPHTSSAVGNSTVSASDNDDDNNDDDNDDDDDNKDKDNVDNRRSAAMHTPTANSDGTANTAQHLPAAGTSPQYSSLSHINNSSSDSRDSKEESCKKGNEQWKHKHRQRKQWDTWCIRICLE